MKRLNVILGKKQLVAAGLTVLLGTAVAVNFIYSGGKDKKLTEPAAEVSGTTYGEADLVSVDKSGEAADSSAYFAQARLDKQSSREEAAEVLQSMYQGGEDKEHAAFRGGVHQRPDNYCRGQLNKNTLPGFGRVSLCSGY